MQLPGRPEEGGECVKAVSLVSDGKEGKNYAKGHRARLRARYRLNGEAALQDYELLELLLTFAISLPGKRKTWRTAEMGQHEVL